MAELLEHVGIWIQQLIGAIGYPGIFVATLVENLFPPIPSELIMPFSGFLVGQGSMGFVGTILAGTAGSVVGAVVIYYLGVWADEPVIRGFVRRYGRYLTISENDLDRALYFFDKYGDAVIFFGRLIPLVRTLISLPAGMQRMPLPKFLLLTTIGTAIWTAMLTYAGVVLGENWENVLVFMKTYEHIVIAAVAVAAVLLVGFLVYRNRSQQPKPVEPERK